MKNKLLKKEFLNGIRCIALIAAFLLAGIELYGIIEKDIIDGSPKSFDVKLNFIGNCLMILIFIFLFVYPHKIEFLAIASFYYSFLCTTTELNNPMGICMFVLGSVILYVRGAFIINPKRKYCILIIVYITMLLCELQFGIDAFLGELLNKLGYICVLLITVFLLRMNESVAGIDRKEGINKLNLAIYTELVPADVILLKKVLENKQYKVIADEVCRSEGTIRNRLNKIYDILGVMDKMGFVSTYTGYEIVYEEETKNETHKIKQNFLYKKKK